MYDKLLVLGSLQDILSTIEKIEKRSNGVSCGDDFALSYDGMLRLDAICMNLITIGEAVKGIDKITKGNFLNKYGDVYWSGVMRMRDKIAHHYFEIDADIVYRTIVEDIPPLKATIIKMIDDINSNKLL